MIVVGQRGDDLVKLIASGSAGGPEDYELLQLVFNGYPMGGLRPLLESSDVAVVRTGVSIVAEAVASAGELPEQIERLLGHPDAKVRYYAVQAVLGSGSAAHGKAGAHAATLIEDPSEPVRRSVIRFLAGAPEGQLAAIRPHLGEPWRDRVSVLLASGTDTTVTAAILERLRASGTEQLIGLAAAIRHAAIDPMPLAAAAESSDAEISEFALHELEINRARRAGWPGEP